VSPRRGAASAAPAPVGVIYVLCFGQPFHGANGGHVSGARHYVGWCADANPQRRLGEHLSGQGSPLVRAVVAAGIAVELVASWPGTRSDERKAHNRHGTRVCPRCRRSRSRQLRMFAGGGAVAAPTPQRIAA